MKDFSNALMLLYGGVLIHSEFHSGYYYIILLVAISFSLVNKICK